MKRIPFILVILCLTPVLGFAQVIETNSPVVVDSTPVETTDRRSEEEKVRFLLSGYEYFPSKKDLLHVGPEDRIEAILISLATKSEERPSLRLRAVDALGYFQSEITRVFLKKEILSKANAKEAVQRRTQKRIRSHAITSFAKAAGKEGLAFLSKVAVHPDLDTRISAIYGIGKHCGKEGRSLLAVLIKSEENSTALRALRKFTPN